MIKVTSEVNTITQITRDLPGPLALVPTMGALHEGHLALIRRARQLVGPDGTVAISIFVNPIQFDRDADLTNYPRPLKNDLVLCEKEGVDLAFTPEKTFSTTPTIQLLSPSLFLVRDFAARAVPVILTEFSPS